MIPAALPRSVTRACWAPGGPGLAGSAAQRHLASGAEPAAGSAGAVLPGAAALGLSARPPPASGGLCLSAVPGQRASLSSPSPRHPIPGFRASDLPK